MSSELNRQITKCQEKIKLMENFISLSLRRNKIAPQVQHIKIKCNQVLNNLRDIENNIKNSLPQLMQRYSTCSKKLQKDHQTILEHLLVQQRRLVQDAKQRQQADSTKQFLSPLPTRSASSTSFSSNLKRLENDFLLMSVTPKMSIRDYQQSPLIKRKQLKPLFISFDDFEFKINIRDFQDIPSYLRGRETYDQLSIFLNEIIIPCFNEKYRLVHRQRSALNHNEVDLWKMYHDQTTLVPGRNFITAGDISRKIDKMIDKKMLNRIAMLRHLGILKEERIEQTTCYIWNVNKGAKIKENV